MRSLVVSAVVVPYLFLGLCIPFAMAQADQSVGSRKITNRVVPLYPALARSMNLSGTVKLEALVLPNGTVKSVQVKGGNPLLVQSAQGAVQKWRWEKAEHETTELIEFNFSPN